MTIHLPAETALALAMALTDTRYDLHAKRTAAEKAIEDLINFLDDTEGDPDLEALGDENDCSWPEGCRPFGALCEDDEDDDPGEDDGCAEPMLGAPERTPGAPAFGFIRDYPRYEAVRYPVGSQLLWSDGRNSHSTDDCEDQNEDGGDVLDAPHDRFLGWPDDFTAVMDPVNCAHVTDGELDDCDDEDSDPAGGDILDQPHDDEGDREYDLVFDFGKPCVSGQWDGPRDCDWKAQRDRPAASLMAAQAMRMAAGRGKSNSRRDPDELTIIAPGVARVGAW